MRQWRLEAAKTWANYSIYVSHSAHQSAIDVEKTNEKNKRFIRSLLKFYMEDNLLIIWKL